MTRWFTCSAISFSLSTSFDSPNCRWIGHQEKAKYVIDLPTFGAEKLNKEKQLSKVQIPVFRFLSWDRTIESQ